MAHDPVTNPAHYGRTKITWLDVADDWKLPTRVANALKYVERYRDKGNSAQDLRKGARFLEMQAEKIERAGVRVTVDIPPRHRMRKKKKRSVFWLRRQRFKNRKPPMTWGQKIRRDIRLGLSNAAYGPDPPRKKRWNQR